MPNKFVYGMASVGVFFYKLAGIVGGIPYLLSYAGIHHIPCAYIPLSLLLEKLGIIFSYCYYCLWSWDEEFSALGR